MILFILGIILFILLIVVHEFGHFIAARKNGVEVEEFGLGFPPKVKTFARKNGTEYTLNWLPLGGFVRLKGEHDSATEKGSFGAAPFSKKALIIAAGVLMNWLVAMVLFTAISLYGMPQLIPNQFQVKSDAKVVQQQVVVGSVEEGSPADDIELKQGAVIVSIADRAILTAEQLGEVTKEFAGKTVEITYIEQGNELTQPVKLRDDTEKGALGIAPGDSSLVRSTWSAPIVGVGTTIQFTTETFKGLLSAVGNLFSGNGAKAAESVAGPVGIVVLLKSLADQGFIFVLFLIAVISLTLAVMNSLPIPALDGGRLFVMALFKVLKKPLSKELEEKIHGTGMLVLLILIALITVIDIRRL